METAVPATRARAWLFQLRSAREKGHQAVLDGNRRSVPVWAQEPNRKMGRSASDAPAGDDDESRRNKFVEQYFQDAKPHQVVALLQAREPARILVAMGDKDNHSPHLEYQQRWIPSSRMRIASQWCWLRQSRAENEK